MSHPRSPVKVLWVSDSPLLGTGFGRVTREVTARLARVPGIQVACLGWGYDGWPYDHAHFPAIIYPSRGPSDTPEHFERVINEFKPDIVITLGEIWMVDWLPAHPTRRQFKWIGYFPIDGGPFYPPWEPILKDVDEVVAMSQFGQQVLQAGLPSRCIHVIYHGVDTAAFHPLTDRAWLKSHERFRGKFVIGCVARNQARKNIPALVKAVASLRERIDNLHLVLHMNPCDVGYDIVTLLHRYRLEGQADVSGPDSTLDRGLSDEQLNRLYNLFDVMVLPSTGEGFGLPIIESFAAGVPVVATDYSACSELVRGRGELVKILTTVTAGTNLIEQAVIDVEDLAARIERLYRNPELVRQYSEAGLAFAQSLNWDRLLPQWLQLISAAAGVDVAA
ncbi:MAG: glycosyltransferase family 4 protein [Verrucomicrobia bacterium]|nr:glycosyltransferase family 4 protein [Verrucomicrobiota bacterium]